MRRLFIGGCLLVLAVNVNAADLVCNYEGNQQELNQCARDEFDAADKQLNLTWKKLLAQSDKSYVKALRKAQRAWIVFRDAEVDAMFACKDDDMRMCWGSMYPLLYHGAMTELTEARTKQLQDYIKHGQNPALGE